MKRRELQKCCVCKRGVMHNGMPTFFRVTIEPFIINPGAANSRAGLEQFFGGGVHGAVLAEMMGDGRDIADPVTVAKSLFVCSECSLDPTPLMALAELAPIPT